MHQKFDQKYHIVSFYHWLNWNIHSCTPKANLLREAAKEITFLRFPYFADAIHLKFEYVY